jgi:hypothetical protein
MTAVAQSPRSRSRRDSRRNRVSGSGRRIADAAVVGVEDKFHMHPIDNRVAIPSQIAAIDHAAGLRAAASFLKSSPDRRKGRPNRHLKPDHSFVS